MKFLSLYEALLFYVPAELATIIISTLPIVELRGAIPLAIGGYGMSAGLAYFLAVIGNMIPALFLIFFLEKIYKVLIIHSVFSRRFFDWLFKKTHKKFIKKYEKHGAAALMFFVAIPLPITGVWTASIAAFTFGISYKVAVPYLLAGVIIAGGIVTLISMGLF